MNSSISTSNLSQASRRYVLCALILVTVGTLGLALLNYFVDPYGCFGQNRLGVFISAERQAKPVLARRFAHDALLLGNSKMGMTPVSELHGRKFFNASFAGATAEEEYYFVNHFARDQRLVLVEVDFMQCDPGTTNGDIFAPRTLKADLDLLFSAKTVEYSVRTIMDHSSAKPPATGADGSAESDTWFRLYDRDAPSRLRWNLENLMHSYDHATPPFRLTFYRRMSDLLRERGIKCVAFVPPLHQDVVNYLRSLPNQDAFKLWRRQVREIFPNLIDLSFGPYSNPTNFFRVDPLHFKPEVGVEFLNEKVIPPAQARPDKL